MRGAASLGYLLARTSDTLADTAAIPQGERLRWLDEFGVAVACGRSAPQWPAVVVDAVVSADERRLLDCSGLMFDWLRELPESEAVLVREVLAVIVSGQKFDLEYFGAATAEAPIALAGDGALDDYAWRVAGCVGEFWTRLGFATLGENFSSASEVELMRRGRSYGIGLQLVNILRDLPTDIATGRCYLPVADPCDREAVMISHAKWVSRASELVVEGRVYGGSLVSRRLRVATVLPSLIADQTLGELRKATWETLRVRIKIPRREVYRAVVQAFLWNP